MKKMKRIHLLALNSVWLLSLGGGSVWAQASWPAPGTLRENLILELRNHTTVCWNQTHSMVPSRIRGLPASQYDFEGDSRGECFTEVAPGQFKYEPFDVNQVRGYRIQLNSYVDGSFDQNDNIEVVLKQLIGDRTSDQASRAFSVRGSVLALWEFLVPQAKADPVTEALKFLVQAIGRGRRALLTSRMGIRAVGEFTEGSIEFLETELRYGRSILSPRVGVQMAVSRLPSGAINGVAVLRAGTGAAPNSSFLNAVAQRSL